MLTPAEKEDLKRRAEELKAEQEKFSPEKPKKSSPYQYVHLGLEFAAIFGLSLFAGLHLDDRFGTKPWLMLLGISCGFALGLYRLVKSANKLSDE